MSNNYFVGSRTSIFLFFLLGMFFLAEYSEQACAQQTVSSALIKKDSAAAQTTDTMIISSFRTSSAEILPTKSGNLAMLFSAILPGAGQVYAHRYYTIPIIWGFGVYFLWQRQIAANYFQDFSDQFSKSVQADTTHQGKLQLKDNRDFYHDLRDQFTIYLAVTYILNLVDAYVGATLYSFDVSDNLGGSASIKFKIPIY